MKILIDECLPHRLRNHLPGHECQTVSFAGFGGLENGDLLEAAEKAKFDVLLTADRGIEYQQEFGHRKIAMIILRAKSIELKHLIPLVPFLLAQLDSIQPGQVARVGDHESV